MSNLRGPSSDSRSRTKAITLAVAALFFHANASLVGQSAGSKHELARADVTIEAQASSAGATLTIAPKSPEDGTTRAAVDGYGKLLAERLPRGELEPLFTMLPARPEMAKRLKDGPVAFTVSHTGAMIRVELIASSHESRGIIHEYLEPVLVDKPKRSANHPGNNLGWDAAREPEVRK